MSNLWLALVGAVITSVQISMTFRIKCMRWRRRLTRCTIFEFSLRPNKKCKSKAQKWSKTESNRRQKINGSRTWVVERMTRSKSYSTQVLLLYSIFRHFNTARMQPKVKATTRKPPFYSRLPLAEVILWHFSMNNLKMMIFFDSHFWSSLSKASKYEN